MKKHGFVLIIVIGLLGVLAALAIQLAARASVTKTLSGAEVFRSKTRLLARSGIETGRLRAVAPFYDPTFINPISTYNFSGQFSFPNVDDDRANWWVKDSAASIDINDGIAAGRQTLGSNYQANAVDPWPNNASGPDDESALINLRLRRLLNAYGDVIKFEIEMGSWPISPAGSDPIFGTPFEFSSTVTGDRYRSHPGRDGLGDHVIANRTGNGFKNVAELKNIINTWAQNVIESSARSTFLGNRTMFDVISHDFTAFTYQDTAFVRMKRELGPDVNGDNRVDYGSNTSLIDTEVSDLDLTDLWENHPVSLVNLNTASDRVRAAVFYAPVNVSVIIEGTGSDLSHSSDGFYRYFPYPGFSTQMGGGFAGTPKSWMMDWMANTVWGNLDTYALSEYSRRPSIGVGKPSFDTALKKDNGTSSLQPRRLMGLRDAMLLANVYREYGIATSWPDSFSAFEKFLRDIRQISTPGTPLFPERAKNEGPDERLDRSWLRNKVKYERQYLEVMLPHLLSCIRRIPSWLDAPIAMSSPYIQFGTTQHSPEDFVYRWKEPKVCFIPMGIYNLHSHGQIDLANTIYTHNIRVAVKLFDTTIVRSQDGFDSRTDQSLSSSNLMFGPEPEHVSPNFYIGSIGLTDQGGTAPAGSYNRVVSLTFDNSLAVDVSTSPGTFTPDIMTMEGSDASFFGDSHSRTNLSPFGGAFFSNYDNGSRFDPCTRDSVHFDPMVHLLPPSKYIGERANKALISLWARIPTGPTGSGMCHTLFRMTFYERRMMREISNPSPSFGFTSTSFGYQTDPEVIPGSTVYEQNFPTVFTAQLRTRKNINPSDETGALHDLQFQMHSGGQSYHPVNNNDYGADPSMLSNLALVPYPTTRSVFDSLMPDLMGSPQRYENSLPNTAAWYSLYNYEYPPNAVNLIKNPTPPETEELTNLFIDSHRQNNNRPYDMRPGSWQRFVFMWDLSNSMLAKKLQHQAFVHNAQHYNNESFFVVSNECEWIPNTMGITFGEQITEGDNIWGSSPDLADKPSLMRPVTIQNFNSSIDNIIMMFGGFPSGGSYALDLNNGIDAVQLRDSILADAASVPSFGFNRYGISPANEPEWHVDPVLPEHARIMSVGARIYDVPFYPQYGDSANPADPWINWDDKAPRIDMDLMSGPATTVPSTDTSNPIIENGINIRSNSWKTYPFEPSTASSRIRLKWMASDTNNAPTTDIVTDIPWVKDF